MNYFSVTSILIVISNIAMAVLLFLHSNGKKANVIFGIFCLVVAIWGIGGFFYSTAHQIENAYRAWQIANICAIFVPVVFYHFVDVYLGIKNKIFLRFLYTIAFSLLFINFFYRKIFIGELSIFFNQFYYIDWIKSKNPLYLIFYVSFYWVLLGYAFFLTLVRFRSSYGTPRNQLKYFILATMIGFLGGHSCFLPVFGWKIYPYLNILIAIYPLIFGYAIVKYRLMDITLVLTRTSIFIAVYSLVLGIPFALAFGWQQKLMLMFGQNWWIIPFISLAVLATVGPFIYIYLQRKAEGRLLKEQRAYQDALRRASLRMGQIKDLARLFELIIDVVTRAAKIEHVAIYLYDPLKRQYLCRASSKKDSAVLAEVSGASELFTYLVKNQDPVVYDEIKQRHQDDQSQELIHIESLMRELNAAAVVPSFIENRLVAFFALGPKSAGKLFTEEDLAAFSILANQAALAIDNINSVEEMKKAQEKLFHAEKLAYVGQLASSIVHEVRNPLTAIKTFVNYLPEKFRIQDLEFLKRFEAIIPGEIERIDKIVHELLDLAKPRRLKKKEVKISEIVNRILESLKDNFQLKKIRVENQCLTQNDKILCDEEQIQQVMLNLILNALDAMKEGGQLTVKIYTEASEIVRRDRMMIALKDTGCGIPQDQLKTLFTPFQTTKKDGVGLGLIITQEIVKLHGGEIQVESEIGRGTQFTVALPVNS